MRIGVISDIHANEEALTSVLDDMPEVDKTVCCGDIVGYGPSPKECVNLVKENCDIIVKGNHDWNVSENDLEDIPLISEEFTRRVLSEEELNWLSSLPEVIDRDMIKVAHSHPTKTGKYVYPSDFRNMLKYIDDNQILLLGHTHIPHSFRVSNKLIANPGSVGQPRDGNVFSSYLLIDTDSMDVSFRRVGYDINSVKEKMLELGYPRHNYRRLFTAE